MKNVEVIVMKSGNTVSFRARSPERLSQEEAREIQQKKDYHPQGYGFYDFQERRRDNQFEYTWNCFASCD